MACRFATCPTNRSPVLVKPTTEGVVRPPSSLGTTLGSPPSITATQELVVPKSIPMIFAMYLAPLRLISALLSTNSALHSTLCYDLSELLSRYWMQEGEG